MTEERPPPPAEGAAAHPALEARPLARAFYAADAVALAPRLLNKVLVAGDGRAGRIIEVEAYRGPDDPASHAFRGRTARNATMWGPPGLLYTYFTYGMHWCANVVTGADGDAQAVLLRALDPLAGLEDMRAARWRTQRHRGDVDLCRGPARLCQALAIGAAHDRLDLTAGVGSWLVDDGTPPPLDPGRGPRVGISVARERPWRFWVPAHPGVSAARLRMAVDPSAV